VAGEHLGRHRRAIEPSLPRSAPEPEQHIGHTGVLYALGDRLHPEGLAELDDGPHDEGVPVLVGHIGHKTAVDLQPVYG
jgi:hypothetical protein